jgi:flagellar hook assembly protein FlgD
MARWDGATTTFVEPTAGLAPPAPNPFRSSTSLTYRVPEAGSVRVSVHDVMGREIAVLDRGSKSPGTYGAVWDGKDERGNLPPAGVYFIRAELPGDDLARKVVRLR